MDYQWHYNKLIETRRDRIIDPFVYYENHHIVLKSMGGSNDSDNMIMLTAREHFLAHWLLWRIHRNRQTAYAFYSFVNFFQGHNHQNRPKITSARGYQEAREAHALTHSEKMTGILNSNRSKKVLQFDLEENFIQEWPSAKEAQRELSICHITDCCRGERKWAGGYIWKYKNPILKKSKPYKKRVLTKKTKPSSTKKLSEAMKGGKWYNNGEKNVYILRYSLEAGIDLSHLTSGKINSKK